MGHGKLKKFSENETFACLLQPASGEVLDRQAGEFWSPLNLKNHPMKGHWNEKMFHGRNYPIVLELGCGKGEYTTSLAERNPDVNYIGVDIKGARLWKGAKYATETGLPNVAFLRTRIEFIEAFFAPGEISEIWLTFFRSADEERKQPSYQPDVPGALPPFPQTGRYHSSEDRQHVPL